MNSIENATYDFSEDAVTNLSDDVAGATIGSIEVDDKYIDSYLNITLTDGRVIRFRYDWIYDVGCFK